MKRVLLRAPVFTQSGYGVHARQIARWLLRRSDVELHVQPLPWGSTPWYLSGPDALTTSLHDRIDVKPAGYDLSVQLQLPNEWDPSLSSVAIGVTAGVESDRASQAWGAAVGRMAHVIVPSEHAKLGLVAGGASPDAITVVPESISAPIIGATADSPIDFSENFGIVIVGQLTSQSPEADRKNIFNTVKWTRDALGDDPAATIILKTNAGRNTAIDAAIVRSAFERFVSEQCPRGPKLRILHGNITDAQMGALYKHPRIRCYVSLTRGEGFGLPTLEAAACGVPVIATDWSAHVEYLSVGKWTRVNKTLSAVPKSRVDGSIFVDGARWAEPDADSYRQKIVKMRDSYRVPHDWAADLASKLSVTHCEEAIEAAWSSAMQRWL